MILSRILKIQDYWVTELLRKSILIFLKIGIEKDELLDIIDHSLIDEQEYNRLKGILTRIEVWL